MSLSNNNINYIRFIHLLTPFHSWLNSFWKNQPPTNRKILQRTWLSLIRLNLWYNKIWFDLIKIERIIISFMKPQWELIDRARSRLVQPARSSITSTPVSQSVSRLFNSTSIFFIILLSPFFIFIFHPNLISSHFSYSIHFIHTSLYSLINHSISVQSVFLKSFLRNDYQSMRYSSIYIYAQFGPIHIAINI